MSDKQQRPAVGIGIFVYNDKGQFLMGRRVGKHGYGTWSTPGGHLEHGESFEECAAREVLEETGVKIKNIRLLTCVNDFFEDEGRHSITIFMNAELASGTPKALEHDKFVDVGWFSFDDLPSPLFLSMIDLQKALPELFKWS